MKKHGIAGSHAAVQRCGHTITWSSNRELRLGTLNSVSNRLLAVGEWCARIWNRSGIGWGDDNIGGSRGCGAASAVGVAQLVERRSVAPNVAGSNPVSHPNLKKSNKRLQIVQRLPDNCISRSALYSNKRRKRKRASLWNKPIADSVYTIAKTQNGCDDTSALGGATPNGARPHQRRGHTSK